MLLPAGKDKFKISQVLQPVEVDWQRNQQESFLNA